MKLPKNIHKVIFVTILLILLVQILEFPAPIGFETRPQDNVSVLWLVPFIVLWVLEIITLFVVKKYIRLAAKFGIAITLLNIWAVIADQLHLFQLEVPTLIYTALEGLGVLFSLALAYFSFLVLKNKK